MPVIAPSRIRCNEHQLYLYRHWKQNPFSDAFHLPRLVEINGPFDINRFKQAWDAVYASQYAFGVNYHECRSGGVVFFYKPPVINCVRFHTIEASSAASAIEALEPYKARFYIRSFDLCKGLSFYLDVLTVPALNKHFLLVNCHRIFCDEQGIDELLANLSRLYTQPGAGGDRLLVNNAQRFLQTLKEPDPGLSQFQTLPQARIKGLANNGRFLEEAMEDYCAVKQLPPVLFFLGCYQLVLRLLAPGKNMITYINKRCAKRQDGLLLGPFEHPLHGQQQVMAATTVDDVFNLLRPYGGQELHAGSRCLDRSPGLVPVGQAGLWETHSIKPMPVLQPDGSQLRYLPVMKRNQLPVISVVMGGDYASPVTVFKISDFPGPAEHISASFLVILQEILTHNKQRINDFNLIGCLQRTHKTQQVIDQQLLQAS